jgi:preprotein translocase subunit YajC
MILQVGGMLAVFYFLFLRPQAQARKQGEAMLAALRKGDEIATAGGIVGKVRDIKDNLITIESGTSTLVVERARIVRVGDKLAGGGGGR